MSRPLAVLRPEPGNTATAARIAAAGLAALPMPLFTVAPLPWAPPHPAAFDSLLITSANAVRHAGPSLADFRTLPVLAVGAASADAAIAAGLRVALQGNAGVAALLAEAAGAGFARALHLSGADRTAHNAAIVAATLPVYASNPRPVSSAEAARLKGSVALVHSRRAGARLAAIAPDRAAIAVAAISDGAARGLGGGWRALAIADSPTDDALIAAAAALAD